MLADKWTLLTSKSSKVVSQLTSLLTTNIDYSKVVFDLRCLLKLKFYFGFK